MSQLEHHCSRSSMLTFSFACHALGARVGTFLSSYFLQLIPSGVATMAVAPAGSMTAGHSSLRAFG